MSSPRAPSAAASRYRAEQTLPEEVPLFRSGGLAITTQSITSKGVRYSKAEIESYRLEGRGSPFWRSAATLSVIVALFTVGVAFADRGAPFVVRSSLFGLFVASVAMFANTRVRAARQDERTFILTIRATRTSSAFEVPIVAEDVLEFERLQTALERALGEPTVQDIQTIN